MRRMAPREAFPLDATIDDRGLDFAELSSVATFPRLGPQVVDGATVFMVYASQARSCRVAILGNAGEVAFHAMNATGNGVFSATVPGVGHGTLYELWLDDHPYPD